MTTIDHRILIPAAPDVVWNYVSDITHNPDWQVDCTDVIFLTSRREGPGLRWRYAAPGGHEMVIAVTAWYNGLGYEYYFVDGTPFRENKGRIRLQEIPEGTIVQWTFTYELGGLLGGMRNSLGMRRQIDQTIADSLKTLWQKIKQSSGSARTLEPKSLMREAPDVEARSAYQPRHPSVIDPETLNTEKPLRLSPTRLKVDPPIIDDDVQFIPVIEEPAIDEGDTRPRSPFTPPAATPRPAPAAQTEPDFLGELAEADLVRFEPPRGKPMPVPQLEPDFLDDMDNPEAEAPAIDLARFEPPRDPSDTQPRPAKALEPVPATHSESTEAVVEIRSTGEETEPLPASESDDIWLAPDADDESDFAEQATVTHVDLSEETEAELDGESTVELDDFDFAETAPDAQESTQFTPRLADTAPAPPAGSASIWEIFGVPRPSETQEMRQLESASAEAASELDVDAAVIEPASENTSAEPDAASDTTLLEPTLDAALELDADTELIEPETVVAESEAVSALPPSDAAPATYATPEPDTDAPQPAGNESSPEPVTAPAPEPPPATIAVAPSVSLPANSTPAPVRSAASTLEIAPIPTRVGLRLVQRRKAARVRRM